MDLRHAVQALRAVSQPAFVRLWGVDVLHLEAHLGETRLAFRLEEAGLGAKNFGLLSPSEADLLVWLPELAAAVHIGSGGLALEGHTLDTGPARIQVLRRTEARDDGKPVYQGLRGEDGKRLEMAWGEVSLAEPQLTARLETSDFRRLLNQTAYAASAEEYRAVFRGIQLEFYPSGLLWAASDGFRLGVAWMGECSGLPDRKAVVSKGLFEGLGQLLGRLPPAEVRLGVGKAGFYLRASGQGWQLEAGLPLLEGEFPDYGRIVPKTFALEETWPVAETIAALEAASYWGEYRLGLAFMAEAEGGGLEVTSGAAGEFRHRVKTAHRAGEGLSVAMNAQYLLDALRALSHDGPSEVQAQFSTRTGPAKLTASRAWAVVVPLRV